MISSAARADALPNTILGSTGVLLDTSVTLNASNPTHGVYFSFPGGLSGYGGGFGAVVDGYNTTVWCVDVEEDTNFGQSYHADVVSTANLTGTNLNDVKYGNVTGSGWAMSLGANNDNATARYQMAAYLASHNYSNFPNGPANTPSNADVQLAIWEVMFNNSISNPNPSWSALLQAAAPDSSNIASLIGAAETFVDNPANASYFNNFAIVSGNVVDQNGTLGTPGYQTYLVQLSPVPEPSSWLALFAGLALLSLAKVRSRRQTVGAASASK